MQKWWAELLLISEKTSVFNETPYSNFKLLDYLDFHSLIKI